MRSGMEVEDGGREPQRGAAALRKVERPMVDVLE